MSTEPGTLPSAAEVQAALKQNWGWFLALGIVLIILGGLAIAAPLVVALAIEILLGWILVIGGLVHAFQLFQAGASRTTFMSWLMAILQVAVGVVLLVNPLAGVMTLTLFLAAYFTVAGLFRIIAAWQLRPMANWGWLCVSGLAAFLLGFLIWMEWPGDAAWVIGLLVGIDLIISGWAMVMAAFAFRSA